MLPITLAPHLLKAALIGQGDALARRQALLAEAGVEARLLAEDAPDEALRGLHLLFVAGLPEGESRALSARARALGILVNVEDVLPLCDFHVPAIVRRGDLLLSVSTGGQAPGLSRRLREALALQFGPEWTGRLRELSLARARWRAQGLTQSEVSQMVRAHVEKEGWL
jgi:precorrin-2 dehydrogenase/sirohydrochlorin ferrochelatase